MIPRLRTRPPTTRTTRFDPRQRRLESLAGEFALLTQRRARTLHQLDLLDQQRMAAADTLHKVQLRLAWLLQHIDDLDPALRDSSDTDVAQSPSVRGADLEGGAEALGQSGRAALDGASGWNRPAQTMRAESQIKPVTKKFLGKPEAARSLIESGKGPPTGRSWAGGKWGPNVARVGSRIHPGKWRN